MKFYINAIDLYAFKSNIAESDEEAIKKLKTFVYNFITKGHNPFHPIEGFDGSLSKQILWDTQFVLKIHPCCEYEVHKLVPPGQVLTAIEVNLIQLRNIKI